MLCGVSMARKVGGEDKLEAAKLLLKTAKTADELRSAQALALPLMLGFDLKQTAMVIGRSVGVTSTMRNQFVVNQISAKQTPRKKEELRNRAHTSFENEALILSDVMKQAKRDGVASVKLLKPQVETRLEESISLTTLYLMLGRHGWKKVNQVPGNHKSAKWQKTKLTK